MLLLFDMDTVVAATRVGRCWQWIAAVACTASMLHGASPSALSCDSTVEAECTGAHRATPVIIVRAALSAAIFHRMWSTPGNRPSLGRDG